MVLSRLDLVFSFLILVMLLELVILKVSTLHTEHYVQMKGIIVDL